MIFTRILMSTKGCLGFHNLLLFHMITALNQTVPAQIFLYTAFSFISVSIHEIERIQLFLIKF